MRQEISKNQPVDLWTNPQLQAKISTQAWLDRNEAAMSDCNSANEGNTESESGVELRPRRPKPRVWQKRKKNLSDLESDVDVGGETCLKQKRRGPERYRTTTSTRTRTTLVSQTSQNNNSNHNTGQHIASHKYDVSPPHSTKWEVQTAPRGDEPCHSTSRIRSLSVASNGRKCAGEQRWQRNNPGRNTSALPRSATTSLHSPPFRRKVVGRSASYEHWRVRPADTPRVVACHPHSMSPSPVKSHRCSRGGSQSTCSDYDNFDPNSLASSLSTRHGSLPQRPYTKQVLKDFDSAFCEPKCNSYPSSPKKSTVPSRQSTSQRHCSTARQSHDNRSSLAVDTSQISPTGSTGPPSLFISPGASDGQFEISNWEPDSAIGQSPQGSVSSKNSWQSRFKLSGLIPPKLAKSSSRSSDNSNSLAQLEMKQLSFNLPVPTTNTSYTSNNTYDSVTHSPCGSISGRQERLGSEVMAGSAAGNRLAPENGSFSNYGRFSASAPHSGSNWHRRKTTTRAAELRIQAPPEIEARTTSLSRYNLDLDRSSVTPMSHSGHWQVAPPHSKIDSQELDRLAAAQLSGNVFFGDLSTLGMVENPLYTRSSTNSAFSASDVKIPV